MSDGHLYELHDRPDLRDPVLVVALDGWIDAGFAAAGAVSAVMGQVETTTVATFDADLLLDHRSRRPVLDLVDGVNTGLTWPFTELRVSAAGRLTRDLLVLVGAEPDFRWRAFAHDVLGLCRDFGVSIVVGFGAYPAPVPHTRPSRLATTATTSELAARVGTVRATLKVPAGAQAAIERACADVALPAVGLWAQVPHYASAVEYPAASALLVEGLCDVAGVELDVEELHERAIATRSRLDALVANSEEHQQLVRQLEAAVDEERATPPPNLTPTNLPSGDELAAELEDFLREQGTDED